MLFVHEVHKVVGKRAAEFEDAYRTEWLPVLAADGDRASSGTSTSRTEVGFPTERSR